MTTRTLPALLLVLLLGLAACGDPEATSTTDPTDQPIPVEPDGGIGDTPTSEGDQPIPVEPDGGIGDASSSTASGDPIPVEGDEGIGDGAGAPAPLTEAPDFGVSSEVDSAAVPPFTSCWSAGGEGVCADGVPQPEAVELSADAQLVVTYAEGELTATSSPAADGVEGAQSPLPAEQENPGIWLVDVSGLDDGSHIVWLSWTGPQGDAFTAVTVSIAR